VYLKTKPFDRVPVATIVKEWCARQAGFTFSELTNSASKQVFAQYYCATIFGTDAFIVGLMGSSGLGRGNGKRTEYT